MFNLRFNQTGYKPYVFISMDGWGIAPPSRGNAVTLARTPNYTSLIKRYPNSEIIASGESVGLPANEVGNSEVGHLTMGVGRVVFQSLERINFSIREETFYQNRAFLDAITYAKAHGGAVHLLGLVGSGNVHSSLPHLMALLEICKRTNCHNVLIHVITDGRDSPPQEGMAIVKELEQNLKSIYGFGRIASIQGRYFGMDRDGRWERIKAGYEAVVMGEGKKVSRIEEAFNETYAQQKSDEFVEPAVIVPAGGQPHRISFNDALIFFNFRVDRARELTMALTMPNFETADTVSMGFNPSQSGFAMGSQVGVTTFKREWWPKGMFVSTMTEYQKGLAVASVAYPPIEQINNSVSEMVSRAGLKQLKLAESEKERMVTYYFDGMREPFPGEEAVIVSSPKVSTYDQKPEMAVFDIVRKFKQAVKQKKYQFIMLNFANPDMVAHTGNLTATIKAIEATDKALGEIVRATLKHDGVTVITADHGNSEELITFPTNSFYYTTSTGTVNTDHSNNPVPLIIVSRQFEGKSVSLSRGVMSDIAPTLLNLMGLPIPSEMTGRVLV